MSGSSPIRSGHRPRRVERLCGRRAVVLGGAHQPDLERIGLGVLGAEVEARAGSRGHRRLMKQVLGKALRKRNIALPVDAPGGRPLNEGRGSARNWYGRRGSLELLMGSGLIGTEMRKPGLIEGHQGSGVDDGQPQPDGDQEPWRPAESRGLFRAPHHLKSHASPENRASPDDINT